MLQRSDATIYKLQEEKLFDIWKTSFCFSERKDQCLVVSYICSESLSGASLCLKFRIRNHNKPKRWLQWARLVQRLKKKVWNLIVWVIIWDNNGTALYLYFLL